MRSKPIGVDLFAGAGGLSLGFERAGFAVTAAVEYDPIHAATHEFNFPNCATICRSVAEIDGEYIRSHSSIGRSEIGVVFGGPPCQGFSMIGKRALDDPRNSLVYHFVRIVSELRPPIEASDRQLLTSSMRTVHTALSKIRFAATPHGATEAVSRFLKLDPRGLCNMLRAGTASDRGAFTSPRPIHPFSPRCNNVRARLHSYPDWFRFHATKWQGFRQVGNSVPPLLGQAVASQIAARKPPSDAVYA